MSFRFNPLLSHSLDNVGTYIDSSVIGGNPTNVLFVGSTGLLAQDSGLTYDAATDILSVVGGINFPKITNLITNGFVKTSGSNGTLSVDTNTYLTAESDTLATGFFSRDLSSSISHFSPFEASFGIWMLIFNCFILSPFIF